MCEIGVKPDSMHNGDKCFANFAQCWSILVNVNFFLHPDIRNSIIDVL